MLDTETVSSGVTFVAPFEWSPVAALALRLPDPITVSRWADEHRWLSAQTSAESGRWKTSRTPFSREPMDALKEPGVETITLCWCTQVGKTEVLMNCLGYIIDQDPGSTLYVLPDEKTAKKISKARVRPMINGSPVLRRHVTGSKEDATRLEYYFDRMPVIFGWSNSAASMASMPCRYVIFDETDKFRAFTGKEASPRKLARERTKTFWNRKIIEASSPSTEDGHIWQSYQSSDRRRYWVPCPHCGAYQVLSWDRVRWPREFDEDPDRIKMDQLATYTCANCEENIANASKGKMLARGVWCPDGCTVTAEGAIEGEIPVTRHRGYHLSTLYSPWLSWSDMVYEYLESRDIPQDYQNFVNGWLAEPFAENTAETLVTELDALMDVYEPRTVPPGALVIVAGVDVHKNRLDYVVRAWGYGSRSWLVDEGECADYAEVEERLLKAVYERRHEPGAGLPIQALAIDAGFDADKVYAFARRHQGRVYATKGSAGGQVAPWVMTYLDRHPRTHKTIPGGARLFKLNVDHYKDTVHRLRTEQPGGDGPPIWRMYRGVSPKYLTQVVAEKKWIFRNRQTGQAKERWDLVTQAAQNHKWDCEVYAAAMADIIGALHVQAATPRRQRNTEQKRKVIRTHY